MPYVKGPTPAASTDNAIVRWDGATGALVKDSTVLVTDGGEVQATAITATGAVQGATVVGTTSVTGATVIATGELLGATARTSSASALGTTTAQDVIAERTADATAGTTVQVGPAIMSRGEGWDTNDLVTRTLAAGFYALPVPANTVLGGFVMGTSLAGAAFAELGRLREGSAAAPTTAGEFSFWLGAAASTRQAILKNATATWYGDGSATSVVWGGTVHLRVANNNNITVSATTVYTHVPLEVNGALGTLASTGAMRVASGFAAYAWSGAANRHMIGSTAGALTVGDANSTTQINGSSIGFFTATPVAQPTSGADLTNNVTAGGTDNTIDNWTDLTTYATDAAAIRNAVYQLARKVKQVNDGLRDLGLLT